MLVRSQLRLQRTRQPRFRGFGRLEFGAPVQPALVRVEFSPVEQVNQCRDSERIQSHRALRQRGREVRKVIELTAESAGQRHELAIAERQEARAGIRVQAMEKLLQVQHVIFIDDQFARNPDPLRRGLDLEPERRTASAPDDAQ